MEKINMGVLCPSEIAFRRFMPALKRSSDLEFIGIAAATGEEWSGNGSGDVISLELEKAKKFNDEYGGEIFKGYSALVSSEKIDAVYIPLPPALHYKWAKKALENGKHILVEKPFTTSFDDTEALIKLAKEKDLAVHENYMFVYHTQLERIKEIIKSGIIGEIRLIRIDFGFPFRGANDFRYDKSLGGGALLDCGGYTLKLASMFLGDTARIAASQLNSKDGFEVDIYGSATLTNDDGLTAQVSFGMDNSYRCSLDIWGSAGSVFTNRILTAPEGFEPTVTIRTAEGERTDKLPADDTFRKSLKTFEENIRNRTSRISSYDLIFKQAKIMYGFMKGVDDFCPS